MRNVFKVHFNANTVGKKVRSSLLQRIIMISILLLVPINVCRHMSARIVEALWSKNEFMVIALIAFHEGKFDVSIQSKTSQDICDIQRSTYTINSRH